jgi:hypothetical protein
MTTTMWVLDNAEGYVVSIRMHGCIHFSLPFHDTEELRNVCPDYYQPLRKEDWTLLQNKSALSIKKTSSIICRIQ